VTILRLKNKQVIPYNYWKVKDRLTGQLFTAVTWDHLLSKMIQARRANGVPVGLGFEDELETWAAQDHPDEAELWNPDMPRKTRLDLDTVVRGTKVLLAFKLAGSPLVSQEEAERRATICSRCYLNTSWSRPCSVCKTLTDVVRSIVGNRTTSVDDKLFACNLCGCDNHAQVHLPLDILAKGVTPEMVKQFAVMAEVSNCWKQCAVNNPV